MNLDKILETRKILKPIIPFNDLPLENKMKYYYENYTEPGILEKILKSKIQEEYTSLKALANFLLENWAKCDKSGLNEEISNINGATLNFAESGLLFQNDENTQTELIGSSEPDYMEDGFVVVRFFPSNVLLDVFEKYLLNCLVERERDNKIKNGKDIPGIWLKTNFNLWN